MITFSPLFSYPVSFLSLSSLSLYMTLRQWQRLVWRAEATQRVQRVTWRLTRLHILWWTLWLSWLNCLRRLAETGLVSACRNRGRKREKRKRFLLLYLSFYVTCLTTFFFPSLPSSLSLLSPLSLSGSNQQLSTLSLTPPFSLPLVLQLTFFLDR